VEPLPYFGTTDWFPPGDPGGGITGVVAAPRCGGCTCGCAGTFREGPELFLSGSSFLGSFVELRVNMETPVCLLIA